MPAEAAWELNVRGVGQVSLGDVAARLGVTRAALYNCVGAGGSDGMLHRVTHRQTEIWALSACYRAPLA